MGRTRRPQLSAGQRALETTDRRCARAELQGARTPAHRPHRLRPRRRGRLRTGRKLRLLAYWTRPQHAREPGSAYTSAEHEALTLTPRAARSILTACASPRPGTPATTHTPTAPRSTSSPSTAALVAIPAATVLSPARLTALVLACGSRSGAARLGPSSDGD